MGSTCIRHVGPVGHVNLSIQAHQVTTGIKSCNNCEGSIPFDEEWCHICGQYANTPPQITRLSWEDLRRVADMAVREYHNQAFQRNIGHEVFRVPNNWEGRLVRWILRRYLNNRVYKLTARGRKATDGKRHQYSIPRSEEHTSELQSPCNLVCRLLFDKKNVY